MVWQKLRLLSSADALRTHMDHRVRPRCLCAGTYSVSLPINDKRRLLLFDFRYDRCLGTTTRTDCEQVRVCMRTMFWGVSVRLEHWKQDAILYCVQD